MIPMPLPAEPFEVKTPQCFSADIVCDTDRARDQPGDAAGLNGLGLLEIQARAAPKKRGIDRPWKVWPTEKGTAVPTSSCGCAVDRCGQLLDVWAVGAEPRRPWYQMAKGPDSEVRIAHTLSTGSTKDLGRSPISPVPNALMAGDDGIPPSRHRRPPRPSLW